MSAANDTAREKFDIYIHVDDEDELYNSFDRRKMLISDDLVSFVTTICDAKPDHMGIRLIISGAKINQKRLRSAIDLYIDLELARNERQHKTNFRRQLIMFLIGMAFISLYYVFDTVWAEVPLEFIATIGSFSLWEAANVWLVEGPERRKEKRFYDRLRSIEIVSEGVEEDDAH